MRWSSSSIPSVGSLDGIRVQSPTHSAQTRIMGPAVTVKMVEMSNVNAPKLAAHFADCNEAGKIMYIQQPKGLYAVCYGGLMSTRAQHLGAKVFSRDTSILGSNTFTRASEINVPLQFKGDLWINPADILVGDTEGVVAVPPSLVDKTVAFCEERAEIDAKHSPLCGMDWVWVTLSEGFGNSVTLCSVKDKFGIIPPSLGYG
ncbi:ribonuclease E inhibitor RraA/Dimethylmenaquinone methyltransferase [Dactylonectria estremocensis]|uniref:Ribonuclease E inhibitor RraA/Dimethylmenaquinone methyltransferase n=1 Tax=Dactylonectria estremocensis TaxID=1079267 RepID=A0A9P9DPF8_9HYPO|nr:ribonuclease E inhibitor RraA/Dimethylmenaquinone methyltransferase [Dactylonectria estremocensis]